MLREYRVAPDGGARTVLLVLAVADELLHSQPPQHAFLLPQIQTIGELATVGFALEGIGPDAFCVPKGNVGSQEKRIRAPIDHALVYVHVQEAGRARTAGSAIESPIVPAPRLAKVSRLHRDHVPRCIEEDLLTLQMR